MEARELLKELKRTVDELQAFNEIGKALTSTLDIAEVLKLIMDKVGELLHPSNFSLLLLDEAAEELVFEIVVGPFAGRLRGLHMKLGEGIAGWVAQSGQPLLVKDALVDARFTTRFDEATRFQTRSVIAVPLRAKARTLGVIELVNGPLQPAFCEDDLKPLSSIADYAAIALENARNFRKVQELTVIDEHTGLFNSRHLMSCLGNEVARARRFGHPVSLVFFDLDRFKEVNDTHGHQCGSALLRECGQLVRSTLRATDIATRYGGDEFVCLLPETGRDQAMICALRLRETVAAHSFLSSQGLAVKLSASFGVSTFPDDGEDEEALLKQADLAMYRVKESGRNGVQSAHSMAESPRGEAASRR
ncbi:MAG: sensor domain-containing diguanylate cyclase [Deltaproteobacteria bacterium]|nr:sensor domain-containing diguanylate cyclase [Deltaproteobacteria bacterium]